MKKTISLILILSFILTSCSGGGNDKDTIQKPTPIENKYAEKQVYKTVYDEEIQTINYLITATDLEFALAANLVDTLVDYDKYGILKPGLAESWEISDDGLTWTFHLRKKVKWVDFEGNEVAETTANDFVSAAQYLLTPANESAIANLFYGVINNAESYFNGEITDFSKVGVKAVDDYTLVYTLREPVPYFESMLTYVCFFPVYGPYLEKMGNLFGSSNSTMLYNGSYLLSEFESKKQRILTKNHAYWDAENIFIEKLEYKYNDEATSLASDMFKRGEISDVYIPLANLHEWMNDPELKAQVRPDKLGSYTYFYAFNFEPKFEDEFEPVNWKLAVNNLNFRKSIQTGLNRITTMTTEDPYNPEYRIINSITPPNFSSQNGLDYTLTKNLASLYVYDFFNENQAKSYRDKAVEELKSAGATFPIKILMPYNTNSTFWANEAQVLKQQLETTLGSDYIEIILLPHAPTGFLDATRRTGNYALMKCNWGPDYADPQTYTDPFERGSNYNFPEFTTQVDENGQNVYEVYESMVLSAEKELVDLTKRYETFANAEAYLIENAFVIPYSVGGGNGYMASKVNPFESQFSPFGISSKRWKGQKLLSKPMNTEEFKQAQKEWQKSRDQALKEE
ncbi:MAG: ABC-type transporter, periplasmic subunit [Bacillota bacterium]|nr:ABC-type transporter, periplasmic subunit [Bacillota bacterium]